ncbi:unnamed protein product [Effrenium voratum]|nr:unnamed protein product [Effrenium voratum]
MAVGTIMGMQKAARCPFSFALPHSRRVDGWTRPRLCSASAWRAFAQRWATVTKTVSCMNNLGGLLIDKGHLDEAEALYRESSAPSWGTCARAPLKARRTWRGS